MKIEDQVQADLEATNPQNPNRELKKDYNVYLQACYHNRKESARKI